jgi:hypothetical protein
MATSSVMRARTRSGCSARLSSTRRFHVSASGAFGRPYTVQRLSFAVSARSAMNPPPAVSSTPFVGSVIRAREIGDEDGGSTIDSCPPAAVTGMTMSRANTDRPARDSRSWGGVPWTSDTCRPSSAASRTISPAGMGTFDQPSRSASMVRSARPATASPSTCKS